MRLAQGAVARLCAGFVCLAAQSAGAQALNLTLSRLRVDAGTTACPASFTTQDGRTLTRTYCPDQPGFAELLSEYGVVVAPSLNGPVYRGGPRAFSLNIGLSLSTLNRTESWRLGTFGDGGAGGNTQLPGVLSVVRLSAEKGLPLGLSIGGTASYVVGSVYSGVGGWLQWNIFEGHRIAFPDLALRGSFSALIGDARFFVLAPSVDLLISKSFPVGDGVVISPFAAGQIGVLAVVTSTIDFTPNVDSFTQCNPDPSTGACRGNSSDINNENIFSPVQVFRPRAALGLELRAHMVTLSASGALDIVPLTSARQFTFDVALGLRY